MILLWVNTTVWMCAPRGEEKWRENLAEFIVPGLISWKLFWILDVDLTDCDACFGKTLYVLTAFYHVQTEFHFLMGYIFLCCIFFLYEKHSNRLLFKNNKKMIVNKVSISYKVA